MNGNKGNTTKIVLLLLLIVSVSVQLHAAPGDVLFKVNIKNIFPESSDPIEQWYLMNGKLFLICDQTGNVHEKMFTAMLNPETGKTEWTKTWDINKKGIGYSFFDYPGIETDPDHFFTWFFYYEPKVAGAKPPERKPMFGCIDIDSLEVKWEVESGSHYMMSFGPCQGALLLDKGKVYVNHIAHNINCYDAKTGKSLWSTALNVKEYWDILIFPMKLHNGKLYFGVGYNVPDAPGAELFCMDPATGKVIWQKQLGVTGDEVVFSELVFFDGKIVFQAGGWLIRVDETDGRVITKYPLTGYGYQYDNGKMFFADGLSQMVCYDYAKGKGVWYYDPFFLSDIRKYPDMYDLSGEFVGYGDGKVIYDTGTLGMKKIGRLLCLDGTSGKVVWDFAMGDGQMPASDPVFYNGMLYFITALPFYGSLDYKPTLTTRLYCMDIDTGKVLWKKDYKTGVTYFPILKISGDVAYFSTLYDFYAVKLK